MNPYLSLGQQTVQKVVQRVDPFEPGTVNPILKIATESPITQQVLETFYKQPEHFRRIVHP